MSSGLFVSSVNIPEPTPANISCNVVTFSDFVPKKSQLEERKTLKSMITRFPSEIFPFVLNLCDRNF